MIPIFEQGNGKGIGHGVESFLTRFQKIAFEHIKDGKAKSLAFVFYNFTDQEFKRILKDQGVFAQLDRLSGDTLSIFYLHSGNDNILKKFNATLMDALGVSENAKAPCVVFCKATQDGFTDISIANLESPTLVHGFHELYGVIETYMKDEKSNPEPKYITWVKGSLKFLSIESIKAIVKELVKIDMFGLTS